MNQTDLFAEFRSEIEEMVQQLDELLLRWEGDAEDPNLAKELFRQLHTLKGSLGFIECYDLAELVHAGEELLSHPAGGKPGHDPRRLRFLTLLVERVRSVLSGSLDPEDASIRALALQLRTEASTPGGHEAVDRANVAVLHEPDPVSHFKAQTSVGLTESVELERKSAGEQAPAVPSTFRPGGAFPGQTGGSPLLVSSLLGANLRPYEPGELSLGPWSPERLSALSQGSTTSSLRARAVLEAPERDSFDLLLDDDVRLEELFGALRESPELVQAHETYPELPEEFWESTSISAGDSADEKLSALEQALVVADASPETAAESSPIQADEYGNSSILQASPAPRNGDPPVSAARVSVDDDAVPVAPTPGDGEEPGRLERSTTVRVDIARLDSLLNLLGEMLQVRHRQKELVEALVERSGDDPLMHSLTSSHRELERLIHDLQDAILSTRMLPIQGVFRRYPRVVRDLAARLGREVELVIQGEDTEIDRALLEGLFEPLVHLIRNAIDHGLEPPQERLRAGKARRGILTLSALHEGNQIVLEIRDDGRGMDPEEIVRRAISRGLISRDAATELSTQDKIDLIFLPGFTSREEASETSGRGIGMSLVREHLRRIGGLISVSSRPGEGTDVRIMMPLTLALLQILLVRVGETRFAIPLSSVVGVQRIDRERLTLFRGGWYLTRPGSMLPLYSLATLLGLESAHIPPERCYISEVGVAERRYGIWVDGFMGIFESVIKSLDSSLTRLPGVMGGTFVGAGELVLVLDMGALLDVAQPQQHPTISD